MMPSRSSPAEVVGGVPSICIPEEEEDAGLEFGAPKAEEEARTDTKVALLEYPSSEEQGKDEETCND